MIAAWSCRCCAVPKRLLRHLADQSDEPDRAMLQSQDAHSRQLRSRRATHSRAAPASIRGQRPLHRHVYDGDGQILLPGQLLKDDDSATTGHADSAADSAFQHLGTTLEFLRGVLGRDSVDGKGMRVDATVHYGYRFANAMWTGEQMIIGDGDGRHIRGLAQSLSILAHELGHGVSQHLVRGGLGVVRLAGQPPALRGEAGALNESFSDVLASLVKQWRARQDVASADWLVGEDILAPHAGKAVRSLKEPGNTRITWAQDDQIADYRRFSATDEVHKASGIANRAFYLAASELGGFAWESLGPLWLGAYARLRPRASFVDAAHAIGAVAAAQHGGASRLYRAVKDAWKAVYVLR